MRLGWVLLLAYLPLILFLAPQGLRLPDLAWRVALFHGAGTLWSAALVAAEGLWPRRRALFARPVRGVALALILYALAGGLTTLLLAVVPASFAGWVYLLLWPFDFTALAAAAPPVFGRPWLATKLLTAMGSWAEEWIFRCALWLRWAGPLPPRGGVGRNARSLAPHLYKLCALSLYFSLLHLQQGPATTGQALIGSLVLGLLLLWRGNFALIATLHMLFNWKVL